MVRGALSCWRRCGERIVGLGGLAAIASAVLGISGLEAALAVWQPPMGRGGRSVATFRVARRWRTSPLPPASGAGVTSGSAGMVEDAGRGQRNDGVAQPARFSGLLGLSDRVAALEGGLDVISPLGAGTTVTAWIPSSWVAEYLALLRAGGSSACSKRQGWRWPRLGGVGDAEAVVRKVRAHKPTSPSSTCGCLRRSPTRGWLPRFEIRAEVPPAGVLVLSQYVEVGYARDCSAEGAGGVGYLLKDRVGDHRRPVRRCGAKRVGNGGSALDPEVVSADGRPAARATTPLDRAHPARAARCWG